MPMLITARSYNYLTKKQAKLAREIEQAALLCQTLDENLKRHYLVKWERLTKRLEDSLRDNPPKHMDVYFPQLK
jgi:hypothetical protein